MVADGEEPSSWGDALRSYEADKRGVHFETKRPERVTRREVAAAERSYDPILQVHRQEGQEARQQKKDAQQARAAMNKAWAKTVKYETPYNVINKTDKATGKPHDVPARRSKKPAPGGTGATTSGVAYNIVSNGDVAIGAENGVKTEVKPQRVPRRELRDVNILSNQYLEDHEAKAAAEEEVMRKRAHEQYAKARQFDLVTGTFTDAERDEAERVQREEERLVQSYVREVNLPPAVRESEGAAYDITSGHVLDEDKFKRRQAKVEAKIGRMSIGKWFDDMNRDRMEADQDKAADRALHRIAPARHMTELRKGYDLITNTAFTGHDGRPPHLPRVGAEAAAKLPIGPAVGAKTGQKVTFGRRASPRTGGFASRSPSVASAASQAAPASEAASEAALSRKSSVRSDAAAARASSAASLAASRAASRAGSLSARSPSRVSSAAGSSAPRAASAVPSSRASAGKSSHA